MLETTKDTRPIRHIYRWDLDKTYLDTDLRLHRIWKIPFEAPSAKRNVPGAVRLLKELMAGQDPSGRAKVTFISASPHQLRRSIEAKFRYDDIYPDQLYLKPNLQNLIQLRWKALREHVGYKLPLLLEARVGVPSSIRETCFGDDAESDALIYSLYADLVAGRIGDFTLTRMLHAVGAYEDAVVRARSARRKIVPADALQSIFIHMTVGNDPDVFRPFGPRVIPVHSYFQAALCLFGQEHLTAAAVVNVAHDMIANYGFTAARLAEDFKDILRRGFFTRESAKSLGEAVRSVAFPDPLPPRDETIEMLTKLAADIPPEVAPPPEPVLIDYPTVAETMYRRARRETLRSRRLR